jgi:hypothetical protein
MKIPHNEKSYVSEQKLTEYLLSETHAVGKSKAKYFRALGYNEANFRKLQEALADIAKSCEVVQEVPTSFGTKYIVDGQLLIPNGDTVRVRTIWIIEPIDDSPRFVTAYPTEKNNERINK